jgi:hypothetical protein
MQLSEITVESVQDFLNLKAKKARRFRRSRILSGD